MEENNTFTHRFIIECPFCGNEQVLDMTQEELDKYNSCGNEPIQKLFPDWSRTKREMLISGICPNCWVVRTDEEIY